MAQKSAKQIEKEKREEAIAQELAGKSEIDKQLAYLEFREKLKSNPLETWDQDGDWGNIYEVRLAPGLNINALTEEDWKIIDFCHKHYYGVEIVTGKRGQGKTQYVVWALWQHKEYFGRRVATDFPLKPAFGEYKRIQAADIDEQFEILDRIAQKTGDWKPYVDGKKLWLPGSVIGLDELKNWVGRRQTQSKSNRKINKMVTEIRHYDVKIFGMVTSLDRIDQQETAPLISAESRCMQSSDPRIIEVHVYQKEHTSDWGKVELKSTLPDRVKVYIPAYCNLYWTKAPIARV